MLTKILFVIIFGFGGWFLAINYPPNISEPQYIRYSLYVLFIVCGIGAGFIVGHLLAMYLTKFLPYEYQMLGKHWDLSPFSDGETYLVRNNEGDIRYIVHPYKEIQITKRKDVFSIETVKESVPHCTCYFPTKLFFLGLFGDFSYVDLEPKMAFVVPKPTMIKHEDVSTITNHQSVSL